ALCRHCAEAAPAPDGNRAMSRANVAMTPPSASPNDTRDALSCFMARQRNHAVCPKTATPNAWDAPCRKSGEAGATGGRSHRPARLPDVLGRPAPGPCPIDEVVRGLAVGGRPQLDQVLHDESARAEEADPLAVGK